jgi:hypothetical protein
MRKKRMMALSREKDGEEKDEGMFTSEVLMDIERLGECFEFIGQRLYKNYQY